MSDAARERLKNLVKTAPDTMGATSGSTASDFARAAGQGLSFGFGDEIFVKFWFQGFRGLRFSRVREIRF